MKRIKSLYILLNNLQERWFKSVKILVRIRGRVGQHGGGGGFSFTLSRAFLKLFSKNSNTVSWYMELLICKHLTLLIFISLDFGLWTIFMPHKVWCMFICGRSSWELHSPICDMTLKSSCYKRWSIFKIKISGENSQNHFLQVLS